MQHIQIVNKGRGKSKEPGRIFAAAVSEEVEKIARREAVKNNFDISKESNGLMRAMMHVLSRKELLLEAGRLAREKLEKEGKIPIEDSKIVKHNVKNTS